MLIKRKKINKIKQKERNPNQVRIHTLVYLYIVHLKEAVSPKMVILR